MLERRRSGPRRCIASMKRQREADADHGDPKASENAGQPSAEVGQEATVIEPKAEFWKLQLEAVYQRRNPRKLAALPALLEKYRGNEATLYVKVCKTYDLDPQKLYTDPKSWEEYEKDTLEEETGADDTSVGEGVVVPDLFKFTGGPRKHMVQPDLSSSDDETSGRAKASDLGASSEHEKPAECKTQ